jgi:polyphosphate kinase 2 (PPK2 family)
VHLLNEWMDPRWIVNRAFDEPSQDERERPHFWRYWLSLPPGGRIGLFLSARYSQPLLDRVARRLNAAEFDAALQRIAAFERTLADDGAVILKFLDAPRPGGADLARPARRSDRARRS